MSCKKRYSNLDPNNYNLGGSYESYGGNSGLLNGGGSSSSGWTPSDTVNVVKSGTSALTTILTSIFGRNNIQQANYTNQLYDNERRTNTILFVIIGLMVALGVVLVIRKTK